MKQSIEKKSGRNYELARNIQRLRKEKGLTQVQLAEKLGITLTYMGYFEIGYRIPSLRMLYKIADTLEVQVKDLIPF